MPTAGPIKLDSSVGLLVSNGLLKEHETRDRKAVGEACLTALEQWSMGPWAMVHDFFNLDRLLHEPYFV